MCIQCNAKLYLKHTHIFVWLETLEEGEWKPLNPGYDFLKMIDEENAEEDQVPTGKDHIRINIAHI